MNRIKIVVVTGPTATGKTRLAVRLAEKFGGEVVSADSRQVYRRLDIGSGKDVSEYGDVPHHLIDIVDPGADYHLKAFCDDARAAVAAIAARGRLPVVCGGSALYIHALLKNYDLPGGAPCPEERAGLDAASLTELQARLEKLDPEFYAGFADRDNFNRLRRAIEIRSSCRSSGASGRGGEPGAPPSDSGFDALVLGVLFPRSVVRERIRLRLDARLEQGMVDEVRGLHDRYGMSWEKLEFLGLEYRFVAEYLQGKTGYDEMRGLLLNHIRQFAKRQDIFFRKMEREGVAIHWINEGAFEPAAALTADFIAGKNIPEPTFRLMDFRNPAK
ncbi:MAG: tRNA (adenosine(37)-N6)-dimethylallyltransferase MiaA [Victivallaceae bacterium]|nr:tRNA (adenosine(37)-N6)-dimethylallyltransferase MiaA [Victivallaceae bacterium]